MDTLLVALRLDSHEAGFKSKGLEETMGIYGVFFLGWLRW